MSLEKLAVILLITTLYIPPQTVVKSHAVSGIYSTTTTTTTATATSTATTTNSDDNIQPDRHNQENRKPQPQKNIQTRCFLKRLM